MDIKGNTGEVTLTGTSQPSKTNHGAIALMVSLFFIFGIITVFNDVLIPHLKSVFDLSYIQAILIQFTFFSAYFLMAMPAAKVIERKGYKQAIVIGLLTVMVGCLMFYPAASMVFYPLFLLALFVMASGITLLQVSANPYLSALGPSETASARLNLAGGFNSLATVIGPLIGAHFILSSSEAQRGAEAVQVPYLTLAFFVLLVAGIIYFYQLPVLSIESTASKKKGAWKFRNLRLGVLAIFLYVGAEVTVGSFLINYLALEDIAGLSEQSAARYVSMYWGGAMIGRFIGVAFLNRVKVTNALTVVSTVAFFLVTISILSSGSLAVWTIVAVGLFNSVMWPCIFPLGIKGLGEYTSEGSGLMIMGVVGGAVIPLLQGVLADYWSLQYSFCIALVCYAYIAYFGYINGKMTQK
ncbi:sugar MFS transporter [Marinoscillum sp.]|uniref:sugar MFS transporter n=1 Tax=Marinoscillum sp. TaxID=2024838 RepID=UPI003BAC2ED5